MENFKYLKKWTELCNEAHVSIARRQQLLTRGQSCFIHVPVQSDHFIKIIFTISKIEDSIKHYDLELTFLQSYQISRKCSISTYS